MVEIWDGLGLDRLRHGPRHVIARWPRVKYLVRDVGVHIADALHHRLAIALASLKSKDMRRKANVKRDGWLLFDLVGVLLQRVVSWDRPSLKTGGALPYMHEMPGCPRSRTAWTRP
jgi:hypothetical protein